MDLVLSDKREITFDLLKISHREFVAFWAQTVSEEERSAILFKMCGLTADEIENLPQLDWRNFKEKLEEVSFQPAKTDLKNSPSAST